MNENARELTDAEVADAEETGLGAAERLINELRGSHSEALIVAIGCAFMCLERDYKAAGVPEAENAEDLRVHLVSRILEQADFCIETGKGPEPH